MVTDSLICVGSRLRQISAFRPLRTDWTRLRYRRMSWIVSKCRAIFQFIIIFHHLYFIIYNYKLKLEHLSNHTYSNNSKMKSPNFTNFTSFRLPERIAERSLILFLKFLNLSVSHNLFSKYKIVKFVKFGLLIFF